MPPPPRDPSHGHRTKPSSLAGMVGVLDAEPSAGFPWQLPVGGIQSAWCSWKLMDFRSMRSCLLYKLFSVSDAVCVKLRSW